MGTSQAVPDSDPVETPERAGAARCGAVRGERGERGPRPRRPPRRGERSHRAEPSPQMPPNLGQPAAPRCRHRSLLPPSRPPAPRHSLLLFYRGGGETPKSSKSPAGTPKQQQRSRRPCPVPPPPGPAARCGAGRRGPGKPSARSALLASPLARPRRRLHFLHRFPPLTTGVGDIGVHPAAALAPRAAGAAGRGPPPLLPAWSRLPGAGEPHRRRSPRLTPPAGPAPAARGRPELARSLWRRRRLPRAGEDGRRRRCGAGSQVIGGGYTHSPPPEGTGMGAVGAFQRRSRRVSPPRRRRLPVGSSAAVGGCAAGSAPRRGRRLLAERLSECAAPGPPRSARPGPAPSPGRVPPRPARLTAATAPSPGRPLAAAAAAGGGAGAAAPPCWEGHARRGRTGAAAAAGALRGGHGDGRRKNPEPLVAGERCERGSRGQREGRSAPSAHVAPTTENNRGREGEGGRITALRLKDKWHHLSGTVMSVSVSPRPPFPPRSSRLRRTATVTAAGRPSREAQNNRRPPKIGGYCGRRGKAPGSTEDKDSRTPGDRTGITGGEVVACQGPGQPEGLSDRGRGSCPTR